MKLLLISNSTNAGETYLGWPRQHIADFLQENDVKKVLFVPFAGVNLSDKGLEASYDVYEEKVAKVYKELGVELVSIHHSADPVAAVEAAEAIAVGGGNTFHLVGIMQKLGIMDALREKIQAGMPYMGWSAGSNVACPTLCTTNDMPIWEPVSFETIHVIPFQINPHYLDAHAQGHAGETREQRILEYIAVNQDMYVAGLRESCYLKIDGENLTLGGNRPLRVFKHGQPITEYQPGDDINFLMK